jgi:hypothetical protein
MSHKLAPRSSACVFLGYSPHQKGYHFMDHATQRVLISRHVVFDESIFPFASLQPSSAATSFLMMFLLSSFLRLPRTPLRRCPHRRLPRCPRWHLLCRPCSCIACAAPLAYMSLPVSSLTCMLLSTGTHWFPPSHVRHSRIPTGSRL